MVLVFSTFVSFQFAFPPICPRSLPPPWPRHPLPSHGRSEQRRGAHRFGGHPQGSALKWGDQTGGRDGPSLSSTRAAASEPTGVLAQTPRFPSLLQSCAGSASCSQQYHFMGSTKNSTSLFPCLVPHHSACHAPASAPHPARIHAGLCEHVSGLGALWPPATSLGTPSSLISIIIFFFFLIKQERARLLRGQSVQQVGPQGLLYVQQRELAVTSPKDGRLGSSDLGATPQGSWIFYFLSLSNRLHLHSGF